MDVDHILQLISQDHINRTVLMQHDQARETFRLPHITVRDHQEFQYLLTSYIEHHHRTTGDGEPSKASAFGTAKSILERAFQEDQFQEGYAAALQIALDGTNGGMRHILNEITDHLKRRALANHMDHIYHHHINTLSKTDNLTLSNAFYQRFGPLLQQFGHPIQPDTFAWNTRAALDYHRTTIEHITRIAKKL